MLGRKKIWLFGATQGRVGKVIKPGLKKKRFLLLGFFKFFGKKLTKTAKFEKKMKMEAFFIKKHVFWVGMAKDYQR